jgi:GNAT superfamily N-acetyltransferase
MGARFRLRALDAGGDRPLLERLWRAALDPPWPLLPAGLDGLRAGLVAEAGGGALGAVALDPAGGIPLLLVDPAQQRRGVGTGLLEAALAALAAGGARTAALGSGGADYIWPGVPTDLPAATRFFAARGWRFDHTVVDLVGDLRGYRAPAGVHERAAAAGVTVQVLDARDRAEVLAFEAATFPEWLRWFERPGSAVLAARDADGRLVGSLLFRGPDAATVMAPLLGRRAGTIGCVGVAPGARGRGVGSAMVAAASERLRDAGVHACHIGWTVRQELYERVGYRPWRRYRMARRPLGR